MVASLACLGADRSFVRDLTDGWGFVDGQAVTCQRRPRTLSNCGGGMVGVS
jgi:hypothetical protein